RQVRGVLDVAARGYDSRTAAEEETREVLVSVSTVSEFAHVDDQRVIQQRWNGLEHVEHGRQHLRLDDVALNHHLRSLLPVLQRRAAEGEALARIGSVFILL